MSSDGMDWMHAGRGLYDSLAAAAFFLINWVGDGALAVIKIGVVLGTRRRVVDRLHLEDNLEGCVEHFVKSFLLFSGADDEALEGVLLGGLLDLLVADA